MTEKELEESGYEMDQVVTEAESLTPAVLKNSHYRIYQKDANDGITREQFETNFEKAFEAGNEDSPLGRE